MPDTRDLELLLLGHAPILQIETREEKRALKLLVEIATRNTLSIFKWSVTQGLARLDIDLGTQKHIAEPVEVLKHIAAIEREGVYILLDFEPYCQDPVNARHLKEIAMKMEGTRSKLVLVSHDIQLPSSLKHMVVKFELSLPNEAALNKLVSEEATRWQQESGKRLSTSRDNISRLVKNLGGLSYNDARRLIRNAIVDDGAITGDDLPEVMQAKYRLLNRDDVISFEYETAKFSEVGGMARLKHWLQTRESAFLDASNGKSLDRPRGVLLLGVQGCGKSLAAKAIAGIWKVPLLRFDFAALYNKYIGETERNLRESLKTAQVMAPCVLWIDEIEKGISGGNDDGTSKRVLGAFLTWLAENKQHVFVVATANNIHDLPPELIRKGRLDEIFFVDLPSADIRKQIFSIHMQKRGLESSAVKLDELIRASEGFSGSEIEQVIVSAHYASHASAEPVTTQTLLNEISTTRPLSVVMAEQITQLRDWASNRTVAVD
ncbi:MAG: AAA family ATPase [Gammaproteobacteria bacterium]